MSINKEEGTITFEFTEDEVKRIQEYQVREEIPGSFEDVCRHLLENVFKHIEDTRNMTSREETLYLLKKIVADLAKGPKDRFCQ